MDYFVPFWESLRNVASGLRYGIWGVGFCDLKCEPSRPPTKLLQEVVERSQFCYVRDELTRSYLAACQLPASVPCPSVVAVRHGVQPGRGLLHVDNYTTAGADVFEAMQVYGERFAKQTERILRCTNNRLNPANERTLHATLKLYDHSDMVLSSALHGCLIALAMGKKVLAVSGDRKIESCMEAFGLGDWVIEACNVHDVPQRLRELDAQIVPHKVLENARSKNREIAKRVIDIATGRQALDASLT
jgi:polysaccharide pyruvyl transferase WcaK-like protein